MHRNPSNQPGWYMGRISPPITSRDCHPRRIAKRSAARATRSDLVKSSHTMFHGENSYDRLLYHNLVPLFTECRRVWHIALYNSDARSYQDS